VFDEAYSVFELLIKTLENSLTKEITQVRYHYNLKLIEELLISAYGSIYNLRQNVKAIIIIL